MNSNANKNPERSESGRKLRVALNVYPSAFQNVGGGEIQLLKTREYLEKAGVDVELFDTWEMKLGDFDVMHTFGSVKYCLGLVNTAKSKGAKTALSTINWTDFRSSIYAPGGLRVKVDAVLRHLTKVVFPWMPSMRRKLMLASDILFPNSEAEADQLCRLYAVPREKIFVVPNGVDERFLDARPEPFVEKFGLSNFVLTAGRIEPRKNQLNLIRAVRSLDVPVVVLGDPVSSYMDYYEQCREEAGPNVHFIGRLEHESELLVSAYAAADTFVLASWFETPGLAALESALAGAKVVITEGGCTGEYFADMVEYVKPNDVVDISQGIERALNQGKGEKLRNHVRENYLWERVAARTIEGYNSVLGGQ